MIGRRVRSRRQLDPTDRLCSARTWARRTGAVVEVDRTDGSTAVFTVAGKEQHSKNAFPTEQVYGPTASPELRLITCGGSFNRSTGHYTDNTIVFHEPVRPGDRAV